MSPFIHKFLTATQYIAPLMANFDTKSGGYNSTVLYKPVGKSNLFLEYHNLFLDMSIFNLYLLFLGFIYMSPFLHQWLTATQYVAPLMANFDTSLGGNMSSIMWFNTGKINGTNLNIALSMPLVFCCSLFIVTCL